VFAAILACSLGAAGALGLFEGGLAPGDAGLRVASEFFGRALSPALRSEAPDGGGGSLLPLVLDGILATVRYAAAALGLAIVLGVGLGYLGSTAWWSGEGPVGRSALTRGVRRALRPGVYGATRVLISGLRSVHELVWAVLLLGALGRSDLTAVVAIAIPYTGIVAKLFSEMIDEAPRDAALALRGAGATPSQVFCLGLLPRAIPDTLSYLFYQFECALRSSAVLGFFGFPTLGYFLAASFENLHYGEVWTYLYALLALILLVEWWSGAIRRRLR
jgi:phosphonate transport system permease protein